VGVVVSLFWVVQILGTMILRNASPLFLFMDQWLSSLSSSSVSFLATILYSLLVLYLQACLVKGNTIFGIRVPFILKIHPLLLNKTFMNSLLFNCNLMLLSSMATSLLAVWAFPTYLAGSSLGMLSNQGFDHLPLFSAIYGNRIPMIVMEVIVLLTVLVIAGRGLWRRWKRKGKEEAKEK
jgi:LMBR1 domain-containing protein 1